ncbi:hypothetical protein ABBQ38_000403 [Trebouxia sp. C0009 RCD-2024]
MDVSSAAAASSQTVITECDATNSIRPETTQEMVNLAVVWACQHGLIVGAGVPEKPLATIHAPMTVLPTPFPCDSFEKAQAAMEAFNGLFDRVSRDDKYLQTTLRPAAEHDDFTAKLLEIHQNTQDVRDQRRAAQADLVLALNRSDYMLDEPSGTLMQVEMNTISSSFGCLCTLVSQMHRFMLHSQGAQQQVLDGLPENNVTENFVLAMAATVQEHNRVSGSTDSIVVFVVQPNEKNSFDQQWLQTMLLHLHNIKTVRRTLAQLGTEAEISSSGQLSLGGLPVSLVYFRAGYAPTDYPSAAEWNIREQLERCDAALCPSVAYQLAGSKKVQQDLARPGVLERFVDDPNKIKALRDCFAGLWGLDDLDEPETAAVLQEALQEPDRFVLKPQREGGGNNLYGEELRLKLQTKKGLSAFILMQRIRPPINRTVMVREGQVVEADTLSELGIFGYLVRRGDKVLHNKGAGHMMRTKAATSDEGGVAAGFAVLDSVIINSDSR